MNDETSPDAVSEAPENAVPENIGQPSAEAESGEGDALSLEGFQDIVVEVAAVLGKAWMPIEQFLKLGRGAIIELERRHDEEIDVYVNDYLFAKGDIKVIDDTIGCIIHKLIDHSKELE